jgi:dihydroorotase
VLFVKESPKADLVVRSARVLDPVEGIDALLDVRVDAGVVSELGLNVNPNGHRVVEGRGLVLAPAFVDLHVHLRTPGREDEETIATGTAAAAAGGYCAIPSSTRLRCSVRSSSARARRRRSQSASSRRSRRARRAAS